MVPHHLTGEFRGGGGPPVSQTSHQQPNYSEQLTVCSKYLNFQAVGVEDIALLSEKKFLQNDFKQSQATNCYSYLSLNNFHIVGIVFLFLFLCYSYSFQEEYLLNFFLKYTDINNF